MIGGTALMRRIINALVAEAGLLIAFGVGGCKRDKPRSDFALIHVDQQISGSSRLPTAIAPKLVGTYPPETKSGAGYFYDDVLEYRVWLHPENGATPLNGSNDYFAAFAQYEKAEDFSKTNSGAEPPLALVRQREWLDEPRKGEFMRQSGDRMTEWQVQWLADGKRSTSSIDNFLKHPIEAPGQ